jgi:hypothetical protein
MKRILQAMDGVATKPVAGANDMKRFLQVVSEGTNPHKVSLPVQMAMQHYTEVKEAPAVKEDKLFKLPETSKLYTYYEAAEKKVTEQTTAKNQQISETARSIAERVLAKEKSEPVVEENLDYEGSMAKEQLISMAHHALELAKMMDENTQLDAWVQSKISVASDYIQTVGDFLKYGHQDVDNEDNMSESGYHHGFADPNAPRLGDREKRDFKRREMEHELGHEDTPEFKAKMRDQDRGPWYLKVNGKILTSKGEAKVFDWKKGANNYALAIIKNKPELQGKIFLTKKKQDDHGF